MRKLLLAGMLLSGLWCSAQEIQTGAGGKTKDLTHRESLDTAKKKLNPSALPSTRDTVDINEPLLTPGDVRDLKVQLKPFMAMHEYRSDIVKIVVPIDILEEWLNQRMAARVKARKQKK